MQTEYEIKILDIDTTAVKRKLHALGANFKGTKRFLRNTYDLDDDVHKWLRLRTDGHQTTLTLKHIQHEGIDGTKEVEITVEDFDATQTILALLGFSEKNIQENQRESYLLDDVQIEIDTWPGIPSYLEIEGPNKEAVLAMAERLGFSKEQVTTMNTYDVYRRYGKDITKQKELRFTSSS